MQPKASTIRGKSKVVFCGVNRHPQQPEINYNAIAVQLTGNPNPQTLVISGLDPGAPNEEFTLLTENPSELAKKIESYITAETRTLYVLSTDRLTAPLAGMLGAKRLTHGGLEKSPDNGSLLRVYLCDEEGNYLPQALGDTQTMTA